MLIALGAVLLIAGGCGPALQKYEIVTAIDKRADFAAFKTYAWATGWPADEEEQHVQIVAAVNRELAARHLTERPDGDADVTVVYGVLRRTDADLSAAGHVPDRELPRFPVVTLVVRIREADTRRELFSVRSDTPLPMDGTTGATAITDQIGRMFERYPAPKVRD
jgi:hypothetical protein